MATWIEMSQKSRSAMQTLAGLKNRRGAVNRACYAAFSATTAALRKRTMDFPRGFEHPPHAQLGRFVKRHLTTMSKADRDEIRLALSRLDEARTDADYRQEADPTDADMRSAMADAIFVVESLKRE